MNGPTVTLCFYPDAFSFVIWPARRGAQRKYLRRLRRRRLRNARGAA